MSASTLFPGHLERTCRTRIFWTMLLLHLHCGFWKDEHATLFYHTAAGHATSCYTIANEVLDVDRMFVSTIGIGFDIAGLEQCLIAYVQTSDEVRSLCANIQSGGDGCVRPRACIHIRICSCDRLMCRHWRLVRKTHARAHAWNSSVLSVGCPGWY